MRKLLLVGTLLLAGCAHQMQELPTSGGVGSVRIIAGRGVTTPAAEMAGHRSYVARALPIIQPSKSGA